MTERDQGLKHDETIDLHGCERASGRCAGSRPGGQHDGSLLRDDCELRFYADGMKNRMG